ncbi:MAG: hypothetical protein HYU37_17630 [Acidobacteria bacterium]|nr:hypothetical protein [Acidobacteriota bacterium]
MDLNDPTAVALLAADAFESSGLAYALYGGLLTAAYGEPRETRDADLAVIDVSATRARQALLDKGVQTHVTFEEVRFGGLHLSRLTVVGAAPDTGLNTIDLVRPRSARYAEVAVRRAVISTLRGVHLRVLTLEDFIVFKLLSTRERDAEDARLAIRRSSAALDEPLLEREIERLADELQDVDVRGRWAAVRHAG